MAAVFMVAGAVLVWHFISARSSRLQYVTQPAAFTDITASVTETGTVNAINQVSIGSEVSGTIKSISVDFNSIVKAGQVLATLDPTTYQAAENSAQASLDLAKASLNSASRTGKKMMDLVDMANLTLKRDVDLLNKGLVNENQVDLDRTAAETAQQDYLVSQAQIQVATSQVNISRGLLQQSQFSLSKTIIASPYDGVIILRNVSIGQTVAASLQTPTLFTLATSTLPTTATSAAKEVPSSSTTASALPVSTPSSKKTTPIAGSSAPSSFLLISSHVAPAEQAVSTGLSQTVAGGLTDMQVDTSVDEADVGTVKDGQTAQITVPAFPNVVFAGTVLQVRINPTVLQNVVTYDAVVTVHDTSGRLFPGMTAQVDVITATSTHVLAVPVSAVLYRPLAGKTDHPARAKAPSGAGAAQSSGTTSTGTAVAGAPGSKVTVWVLRNGKPVAVKIVIGLSDSTNIEVTSGALVEGDPVITAEGNGGTS
jgi:HlyD family secretion protein